MVGGAVEVGVVVGGWDDVVVGGSVGVVVRGCGVTDDVVVGSGCDLPVLDDVATRVVVGAAAGARCSLAMSLPPVGVEVCVVAPR